MCSLQTLVLETIFQKKNPSLPVGLDEVDQTICRGIVR